MESKLSIEYYPLKSHDKVRYRDTDRQGHVNNAAFSEYLETGRVEFLYDPNFPIHIENSFVIASLSLQLIAEIQWPGTVQIGTGIKRIGNSSITFTQALFQNDCLVATAETVIVQVSSITHKSAPFTTEQKAFFLPYQV